MLKATRNKVLAVVTAAVLALMLMSAPMGVGSAFACEISNPTGTGC